MSLYKQNNLLDVYSIFDCQNNLKLKDNIFLNKNDVNIEGGNIVIDNLYLNNYDSNINVYVRGDNNGNFYINALDSNIPAWLKTDTYEINLEIFNNDVDATLKHEVNDIIYESDFHILNNIPKLTDILVEEFGYIPFSMKQSNLSDLFSIISDTWYIDLEMNKYSLCNYNHDYMKFDNVKIENIKFDFFQSNSGMLINGNNILELSNNALNGKADEDIFGLVMLNSNISNSTNLYNMYLDIDNNIEKKLNFYNFNVDTVSSFLSNNLDLFLVNSNSLNDVADRDIIVETLELTKLRDKIVLIEDEITFTDLNVGFLSGVNDLYVDFFKDLVLSKYPFYKNRYNSFVYIQMNGENNYDVIDSRDIQYAEEYKAGQLKVLANLNSPHRVKNEYTTIRYEYMNDVNVSELSRLRTSLDYINLDNILEIIYLENTALNTRLLRSTNNLIEMKDIDEFGKLEMFKNIQLANIIDTLDYEELLRKPKYNSSFINDIAYIYDKNKLKDLGDMMESYSNMGLGDISVYNTDNFDISGNILEMDYLNIVSKFSHISENNDLFDNDEICFIKSTTNSIFEIGHLPDTTNFSKGVVRMHNNLQYDEEGTYTITALNDIYNDIHKQIVDIQEIINNIHNLV